MIYRVYRNNVACKMKREFEPIEFEKIDDALAYLEMYWSIDIPNNYKLGDCIYDGKVEFQIREVTKI
jgi:hypothetical protein